MNYRHAYHAGNFAEVIKHAILARVVAHLREKPAAFRVLDSHAGAGLPDLADGLARAHRKWPTGTYLAWYPIKDRRDSDAFARKLARTGIPKILRVELTVAPDRAAERLAGTGLMVINPPWTLEGELLVLLPALAGVLGRGRPGTFRLDRLPTKN